MWNNLQFYTAYTVCTTTIYNNIIRQSYRTNFSFWPHSKHAYIFFSIYSLTKIFYHTSIKMLYFIFSQTKDKYMLTVAVNGPGRQMVTNNSYCPSKPQREVLTTLHFTKCLKVHVSPLRQYYKSAKSRMSILKQQILNMFRPQHSMTYLYTLRVMVEWYW